MGAIGPGRTAEFCPQPTGRSVNAVVNTTYIGSGHRGLRSHHRDRGGFFFVAGQVGQLARDLPNYQVAIQKKLQNVRTVISRPGPMDAVSRSLRAISGELQATQQAFQSSVEGQTKNRAAVIANPGEKASDVSPPSNWPARAMDGVVDAMGTASLVLIFTIFILLDRRELRDRVLRLMGGNLRVLTEALNEAGTRVSRYLNTQMLVNAGFGVPLTIGLWFIGVPGAVLWGMLAIALRFIPYAGPLVSAAFPLLLAFAVDAGWDMLMWTAILILTLELISNNVVEPLAYGNSTGLAPLALLLCSLFWAVLWGPIGLILAAPLTVCLVVVGRHFHSLKFLNLMLGSEPAFDQPTRLYQRLAAKDPQEAIDFSLAQCQRSSPLEFVDAVVIPCLQKVASEDDHNAVVYHHRAAQGLRAIIERLMAQQMLKGRSANAVPQNQTRIACVGLRSELDSAAAFSLLACIPSERFDAAIIPSERLSAAHLPGLILDGAQILVISTFSFTPQAQLKFVREELRKKHPALGIVIAAWRQRNEDFKGPSWVDFHDVSCVNRVNDLIGVLDVLRQRTKPLNATAPTVVAATRASSELVNLTAQWQEQAQDTTARIAAAFDSPLSFVWMGNHFVVHTSQAMENAGFFVAMVCGELQQKLTQLPPRCCETIQLHHESAHPFEGIGAITAVALHRQDGTVAGLMGFGHPEHKAYTEEEKLLLSQWVDRIEQGCLTSHRIDA